MMNEIYVEISCGQIKFIREFFKEYEDESVSVKLTKSEKIKSVFLVTTNLSSDDTVRHLKNVFKETPHGTALHYAMRVLE
ncbi:hypothetical protein MXL46_06035 [Heyndrickxia sporothermodurans]|nr:hypothetical protein [Heyndrickxia sporothermodurans]MEB6548666.1 hypothetical protein [Heyndrickxia sporothermodurans]PTY80500.1 hypothetical protein B5V89_01595 [Heyndrickxia sporothermodurans]